MRNTTFYCDICKKETKGSQIREMPFSIGFSTKGTGNYWNFSIGDVLHHLGKAVPGDMCDDCITKLKAVIKQATTTWLLEMEKQHVDR